ncbi:sugar transferase [Aureibaculum sp. 2210JD6-5]|uniref:sugar transferase n=1 Tax=Aureibaculum sp. 2210JD6-5 TaxID=3103957 RepID=UPI002AACBD3C|nr:sugar transferase [Aureibaculum sp. 2210JD6-5]MDY7394192.1 sugar transferase [Aureibaculum sp. 2210JD6-5]
MYVRIVKPILDFILAFIGLVLLSPIFIILVILLSFSNNGTPFFFQNRPGKNEKVFKLIKFKTMTDRRDGQGNLLPDKDRLTPIGKFVRKTSLDELPQLINVLKGEMSLIGPRPLLIAYLNLYTEEQKKRHNIKPGITGWAQINGRNAISWTQKLKYDVWYVKNLSFVLDLKILLKTIVKVIRSEDINTKGVATTEPFNGKN